MKKWIGLLALLMLALVCATALGETNTQVKHYLMLGEDGYAEHVTDDARTDTIVLVSLDTKYNRVILTSILRDSKINNPRGNETKINLLYKNHGFSGIISCLERELDIQIEGAILVNFENVKPVIDALGGVDIAFGGIGINGHLAFNESQDELTPEEFAALHTRVLAISRETRTANAIGDLNGAIDAMPKKAVTIGMAEILGAKKIRLGVFRDWHRSVVRQAAYGEVSAHFPATLIQRHPDAMIIVNANAAKQPF